MLYLGNESVKSSINDKDNENMFVKMISEDNIESFSVPESIKFFKTNINDNNNNVNEYIFNRDLYISSKTFKDLSTGKITFNNVKYIGGIPNMSSLKKLNITYNNGIEMDDEMKLLTDYEIGDGTRYLYDGIEKIRICLFQGRDSLTSITIPSSVKKMEDRCFQFCSNLTSVDLSNCNKLQSIGSFAFDGCSLLLNYDFSKCVELESIGMYCFRDSKMTSLDLSKCIKLLHIEGQCFTECLSLEEIILPDSITTIGYNCFTDCSSLKEINLPDSLTTLGNRCFTNCSSLEELTLPSSLTTLGMYCFDGCSNLKSIDMSKCSSLTTLGMNCFKNCSSLEEITLPSSLKTINSYAFNDCLNLTTITINKPTDSISGAPWSATNATIIWNG